MIYNKSNNKNGYTLIFSVIVAALVLAVGVSILNISRKEFILSSSARESIYAFYAADSGLECAAFHDRETSGHTTAFSTSSPRLNEVVCGGYDPDPDMIGTGTYNPYDFYFELKLPDPDGDSSTGVPCVEVFVRKEYVSDPFAGLIPLTTITSVGYNKGWDTTNNVCDLPSLDRVERSLRYTK